MSYSWSETSSGVQILSIQDWLQDADNRDLLAEIEQRIAAGKVEFVVDLSQTSLINSLGLSVLIQLLTRARNNGGEVVIAHISPKIRQILLVTRLQTMFIVKDDLAEALAFFQKESV